MQKPPKSPAKVHFNLINWPEDFPYQILKRAPITKDINNMHFHGGLEIGLCYEGSGLFSIYNKVIPFSAGDIDIVLSGQPHSVVSSTHDESYWHFLIVDTDRLFSDIGVTEYKPIADMLYQKQVVPNIIKKGQNEDVHDLVKVIFFELEQQRDGYEYAVKALLWAFLLKATRLSDVASDDWKIFYESGNSFSVITPAINFITTNYSQHMTVSQLAEMCFLSETHFSRLFKNIIRMTPLVYLKYVRIRMSTMLLRTTDLPISEIAMDAGYQSLSSFNRDFSQMKKSTPREYRNKYR